MTRYDQMKERFEKFHNEHPEVWALFIDFTFDRIRLGFEHYSVDAITQRIRWETEVGSNKLADFKINDHYRAFYARLFMDTYPDYKGFFRLRPQKSKDRAASRLPELTPADFLADTEGYVQ